MASTLRGVSRQPRTVKPFFPRDLLDDPLANQTRVLIHRQEHHPDAVSAWFGQRKPQFPAFASEKFVRDLDQDARSIARFRIAAAGSAMGQIDENFDALADDFVRLLPVEIDHETHPAGVMFMARVVESLATWRVFHALHYTN